MDTAPPHQKTGEQRPRRSFLARIVEETHQHAKKLCEDTAVAQEAAQEMVRLSQCARQRGGVGVICALQEGVGAVMGTLQSTL
jgi:hypothetical protein